MTSLSPSNSQEIINTYNNYQLNFCDTIGPSVYENLPFDHKFIIKKRAYQKPKNRWMAKDKSMTLLCHSDDCSIQSLQSSPTSQNTVHTTELNNAPTCANINFNIFTPTRTISNNLSPSVSSSAPGTVIMPSSLTNTSSSPSNHTPPIRNELNETPYVSPNSQTSIHSHNVLLSEDEYLFKIGMVSLKNDISVEKITIKKEKKSKTFVQKQKKKEKKHQKTKSRKNGLKLNVIKNKTNCASLIDKNRQELPNTSCKPSNLYNSFVAGGLKIRLRRDNTISEPTCSLKKSRTRKKLNNTGMFRIVESWCDADAPGSEFSQRNLNIPSCYSPPLNLTSGGFRVGDVVWAKLAGYPHWPSRISALRARSIQHLTENGPISQKEQNISLDVIATPTDPSLASGFIATVEWFAWDQCSHLSCAKLFPFMESYKRLFNPRTRVKGYIEAVKLAKEVECSNKCPISVQNISVKPCDQILMDVPSTTNVPQTSESFATYSSNCLPSPTTNSNTIKSVNLNGYPMDLSFAFQLHDTPFPNKSNESHNHISYSSSLLNIGNNLGDNYHDSSLLDLGTQNWAPLPQLDISGFGDIVSHVPTFSEDEDDIDQTVANHLKIELSPVSQFP